MNDEIKEILDNKLYFDLEEEDYIKIKDYITNLQKDLEKANDIIAKDRQFYKSRMDEYVELKKENEDKQKEIYKLIQTSIVQKKQINNLQKRNSRQRLANQKQQDLILKLQEDKKKAVEYIENRRERVNPEKTIYVNGNDLLNILQNGSEK